MKQQMKKVSVILAGAALLLGAALAQAETYDLVGQFSNLSNPNGAWSYGWSASRGAAFNFMTPSEDFTYGHLIGWSQPYFDAGSIYYAVTDINHPTVHVPAGTVWFHPGPAGQNSVIRWTVPASGTYKIDGAFTGRDHAYPTTTDVAILRGPFEVFSSFVESYNVPLPFSATMPLLAGETVDLTVGFGRNGNYYGDSTGIAATITKVSPTACAQPPAGLIGWWTGDGAARDIVGGNNGALIGGTTFSPGLVDRAFSFDGIDDFVAVPDAPALAFGTKDFTVGFWVRFNTTAGEQIMVEKYVEGWPRTGWTLTKMDGNTLRLHLADDPTSSWNTLDVTPPSIPDNTWIFVAAKRQGNTFTIYWNGTPLDSATFPQTLDLTSPASLKFGHRGNPSDTPGSWDESGFYLNGAMDEVQIFGRALTDDEIRAVYLAAGAGQCRVIIDIKPGSFPNSINPRNNGVIPVAILSNTSFDAVTVDPATARFGATGTEAKPNHYALEDVNGDGRADLVLQFPTQSTGIICGATSATLTGTTRNGLPIKGSDSIVTVGCK